VFLLARANGQSLESVGREAATRVTEAPSTTARTATTASPATTAAATQSRLSQRLQATADQLTSRDGARADDLAAGLRQVASDLEEGSPATGGHATGLIISAAAWNQTGQLSDAATVIAVQLLQQVPGVQVSSAQLAPPTAGAPATTVAPSVMVGPTSPQTGGDGGGSGRDKGKQGDDDD
jgi:hypothetical protein